MVGREGRMTKNNNKKDWILFFKYGLLWLVLAQALAVMICFVVAMDITEDGSHMLIGTLGKSFRYSIPVMIIGIPYYCVGFAARGHERKSISLNLEEKDNQEKSILIGVIAKSMEKRPELISWKSIDMKGDE
jgi:hypothetical protein